MGKRWTDKEDTILETLREGGMTYKEMASIMGRTSTAIHQRAYVLRQNEPTFREVVDTAFAKHGIEFGEPESKRQNLSPEENRMKQWLGGMPEMLEEMERDIKPKPQWWKAMMWWRK